MSRTVAMMWRGPALALASAALAGVLAACSSSAAPAPSSTHSSSSSQVSDPYGRIPSIVADVQPAIVTLRTGGGVGSGVVYSSGGEIVTAYHVVRGAASVTVIWADGSSTEGTVQAADEVTDIALVKVGRGDLPAATFADAPPALGDLAVVLGSPLGFSDSVSAGVVAGFDRDLPPGPDTPAGLTGLYQTDAPISPGNSGGAVVDAEGRVIGLAEAYIPPSEGAVNIGFVTPSALVTDIVGQLISKGRASYPYLGAQTADLTAETAARLGLTATAGAAVVTVPAGTPAAAAGLRPGDVITKLGDHAITGAGQLNSTLLHRFSPGQRVALTVIRDGGTTTLTATLTER